jgi:gluconate 2-dehydrogenase gamma chain
MFFNDFEARTVEALAERIVPGDDEGIGATDAGVTTYIDRAVAGFSTGLQSAYRLGLRDLDRFCRRGYGGAFVELNQEQQDEIVRRFGPETGGEAASSKPVGEDDYDFDSSAENPAHSLDRPSKQPEESSDGSLLVRLLAVVREHTFEGLFCDPVYGGNRGAVGWRLVGFPGVQWGYTAEQMKEGFDGRTIPVRTLSDLRQGLGSLPDDEQFTRGED